MSQDLTTGFLLGQLVIIQFYKEILRQGQSNLGINGILLEDLVIHV